LVIPVVSFQFDQFRAVFTPPPKSHFSALLLGQVKTSEVMSCVRSRRKRPAVTSPGFTLVPVTNGSL
jgi:hypothetical protein